MGLDCLLHLGLYRIRRGSGQHLAVSLPRLQVRRRRLPGPLLRDAPPVRDPPALHGARRWPVHQEGPHWGSRQTLPHSER